MEETEGFVLDNGMIITLRKNTYDGETSFSVRAYDGKDGLGQNILWFNTATGECSPIAHFHDEDRLPQLKV